MNYFTRGLSPREEVLRVHEVLEPVFPEVPQANSRWHVVLNKIARGLGEEDLAPVTRGIDAHGAMHV